MIQEPVGDSWPTAQVGIGGASSSQFEVIWQPNSKFEDRPFLASASIRTWAQGQGGQVAQSLVHGLLLPEDIQFSSKGTEESLARRLQWHTIAVILHFSLSHLF